MRLLSAQLESMGYTLRSGNADGSDSYFASGVEENAQIWLPWDNYNLDYQTKRPKHQYITIDENDKDAYDSVDEFHPAPQHLTPKSRLLMMRNYRILMGKDSPNSEFVIAWTKDGKDSGGSGQLLRIAKHYDIPIFNLHSMSWTEIIDKIKFMNLLQDS